MRTPGTTRTSRQDISRSAETDGPEDPASPASPRRAGGRRGRDLLIVGLGLAAGIGASLFADDARDLFRRDVEVDAVAAEIAAAVEPRGFDEMATGPLDESVSATPATTAEDAVETFLLAEVAGDHARSYALLTSSARARYGSVAAWGAAHSGFFPIRDFEVLGSQSPGEVIARMQYRPSLDEVVGLVPARANASWRARQEGGGWLVDHDATELAPSYPADDDAGPAALRWATARQACRNAKEYGAGLVGRAPLAETLCGSEGPLRTGRVRPLDSADTGPFVSAFGAPAVSWARTVRITGAADLVAVLAPIGDQWLVVGVVEPR